MKYWWIGTLALGLCLNACGSQQQDLTDEQKALEQANAAYELKYHQSLDQYDQQGLELIARADHSGLWKQAADTRLLYARYLLRDQRYADAFTLLNQVLSDRKVDQYPDLRAGALINLSYLYEKTGLQDAAILALEDCLSIGDASPYYHAWTYARLDLLQENSRQAEIMHFNQARMLMPQIDNADQLIGLVNMLSETLRQQGRTSEAISLMDEVPVVELSPYRSAYYYNKLGHLYLDLEKYDEAENSLLKARGFATQINDPQLSLWVNCNLSKAYKKSGQTAAAIQALEEARSQASHYTCLDEAVTFAYTELESLYRASNQPDEADLVSRDYATLGIKLAQNQSQLMMQLEQLQITLLQEQEVFQKQTKQAASEYWWTISGFAALLLLVLVLVILLFLRYKQKHHARTQSLAAGITAALQILESTEEDRARFLSKS